MVSMDTMERLLKKKSIVGFRRLLYLVTPNETSFETVNEVPDYVTEAIPFFLILVILEVPLLIWQKRKLPRFNDGFSSIANGILSQLHSLLFRSTELAAYIWMYERFNIINLPWNDPWTWLLGFVGVDFCYYWVHRCGHEVNIFWAAHQTHHSSEDYNLTTALRQSCILKYLSWMFYLPLALVMPPSVFLVHTQFNLLYQFWIHTEVIRTLGPLEWIFNTPSHHRVHHGRNRYCIDKNYGGTLIIFDRIFGTFEAEKDEVVYGLVHNIDSWNPLYSQYCHLKYMAQTFLEVKGFSNKMSVIWKGPGWLPGKPRLGLPEDIPHVEAPVEKYDKHLPLWTNLYIWTHFLILLVGFVLIADHKQSLSAVFIIGCIVYIIYSLSCFGAIFDHRETAPLMEFIRCLVFVVSMYILNSKTITVGLSIAYSVYIVHVASLSLWTYICARHYTSSIKVKPH